MPFDRPYEREERGMRVMVVVGSVREGRVGRRIADWVVERLRTEPDVELDLVDLRELALPMMDEPEHPRLQRYRGAHTIAWSERVDAADAVVLVIPEYNHSYTAPVKNALDYLVVEWAEKPVAMVAYGGLAGGARAVVALEPVLTNLGLVPVRANVEIAWVGEHLVEGRFVATDRHERALDLTVAGLRHWHGRLATPA